MSPETPGTPQGSSTADYRGTTIVTRYDEVEAEWRALDEGAGLIDFSFLAELVATGEERADFLQGQLSQNVAALSEGSGAAALALTAQGRPEALMAVYARGDALEIVVDADCLDRTRSRLEQFLVADDVDFEDAEPAISIGIAGPRTAEILVESPRTDGWWRTESEIASIPVVLRGRADLRVPCVEVRVPTCAGGEADRVRSELLARGAVPAGSEALEILRVESGAPRICSGGDLDDSRVAVEGRLEWAIHFNKGCYVGQEVVERAVSRGRLNRELCLLRTENLVVPGARLADGADRDTVTSVALSPRFGPICLAYLPLDRAEVGSELSLQSDDGTVRATVLEWPRARVLAGR